MVAAPSKPHIQRKRSASAPTVLSEILATIEFWSKSPPSPRMAVTLASLRPAPFVRPPGRRGWLCRFEIKGTARSKADIWRRVERWCLRNSRAIRAARRDGCDVVASMEIYVRHAMYTLPIDPPAMIALNRLGVRANVVFHLVS